MHDFMVVSTQDTLLCGMWESKEEPDQTQKYLPPHPHSSPRIENSPQSCAMCPFPLEHKFPKSQTAIPNPNPNLSHFLPAEFMDLSHLGLWTIFVVNHKKKTCFGGDFSLASPLLGPQRPVSLVFSQDFALPDGPDPSIRHPAIVWGGFKKSGCLRALNKHRIGASVRRSSLWRSSPSISISSRRAATASAICAAAFEARIGEGGWVKNRAASVGTIH